MVEFEFLTAFEAEMFVRHGCYEEVCERSYRVVSFEEVPAELLATVRHEARVLRGREVAS